MKIETIIPQPVIRTERFDLRPLRCTDTDLIERHTSDERLARMTTAIPHPLPPGTSEAFVARAMARDRPSDVWAMDGTKSGGAEVMGVVSLAKLDRNQSEVGYWVAPDYWNTGLASDAVKALVNANPLGSATMFASVFQDNPASARVLIHCGFEYLGDAESFCVARDETVPTWTYSCRLKR